jgi:hypothetical protein
VNRHQREAYINGLDDYLLRGDVLLSEWSTFLVRDADEAFCSGAYLATILVCQAAIECHLRYEYGFQGGNVSFYTLIERCPLTVDLKTALHELRRYRNKWVHVDAPHDDEDLLIRPEYYEQEMEMMAEIAVKSLGEIIYLEQGF